MSNPLSTQLLTHLTTTKNLHPTPSWLTTFLSTPRPSTPLPALLQTATFRLLASDITTSLSRSPSTCFTADITDVNVKERNLDDGAIAVQVLGVEDMSKSRWEQVEAIEALERGEGTKGREIIRVVDTGAGDDGVQKGGGGPHKLLLQDAAGKMVYGIELRGVEGVGLGMNIGCKLVLKGAIVARGVVLLTPENTVVLGGKIEEMHKKWREGRKEELKKAIEASRQGAG